MRILIALVLVAVFATCTHAICSNTYSGCPELRDQTLIDWLVGLDPTLDPVANPFSDCISNSAMNAFWTVYSNANGGKVPFAPNGVGFLDKCKINNKYCLNPMKAKCDCMATCDQVSAAQGMVAAN